MAIVRPLAKNLGDICNDSENVRLNVRASVLKHHSVLVCCHSHEPSASIIWHHPRVLLSELSSLTAT